MTPSTLVRFADDAVMAFEGLSRALRGAQCKSPAYANGLAFDMLIWPSEERGANHERHRENSRYSRYCDCHCDLHCSIRCYARNDVEKLSRL
jgi:hypothetical protein